ncbi:hypothetical protein B0H12DRAFT_546206 [Mycena haematopus]|nr:hypothetical protein B0H12DRAFT_546206 [Mycena haematopus]
MGHKSESSWLSLFAITSTNVTSLVYVTVTAATSLLSTRMSLSCMLSGGVVFVVVLAVPNWEDCSKLAHSQLWPKKLPDVL